MKETIAKNNDEFRRWMSSNARVKGRVVLTEGVRCLDVEKIVSEVKGFSSFTEDNDPHKEHDFGTVYVEGEKCFWKIDYYADDKCEFGYDFEGQKEDKAFRVLTIMLADEY